ncbi:hypothetical protein [Hymenobacter glacieicola]|nr:hypothetical protein [Hymenobacter glacieicola]
MSSSPEQPTPSFTLDQASDWTRRYRDQHTDRIKGHHFSRATLEAILAQPNCAGIRLYYGRDEQNERRLILVGTDGEDQDLLATASSLESIPDELMVSSSAPAESSLDSVASTQIEIGTPCPPSCSISNPLNS